MTDAKRNKKLKSNILNVSSRNVYNRTKKLWPCVVTSEIYVTDRRTSRKKYVWTYVHTRYMAQKEI